MVGEIAQTRQRLLQSQAMTAVTERQIALLENQLQFSAGSETKELRSQQGRLRSSVNSLVKKISSDRKLIEDRATQIRALNPQIASLDQRMQRLDEELAESRKQWLEIRQPMEKYSRGDFEGLRRVLDDWLILDGQWPEAYAWAALCAYELDAMDSAADYLEKARRLGTDPSRSKKLPSQLEALTALIRRQQPGQAAKAESALANALRLADKNSDWETYFLLGRCYFERADDGVRAKSHFERALAIRPTADCAKLWLARLQTTSTVPAVRDVYGGTTSLEQLWEKHGRSSWRLASFLAEAYSAAQRPVDAEAMWKTASELAPANQNVRLVGGNRK
jgi:tetratricopeptide (TPR) repeat protein